MIVLRRAIAILLIPMFLCLFLASVVFERFDQTLFNPAFYRSQSTDLELVEFLQSSLVPFAIDRALTHYGIPLKKHESTVGRQSWIEPESIRQAFPSEWIRQEINALADATTTYISGNDDSFILTVNLDEPLLATVPILKQLVQHIDIEKLSTNRTLHRWIKRQEVLDTLPLGVHLTAPKLMEGLVQAVPERWIKQHVPQTIDDVTPYLLGRTDGFTTRIPIQERQTQILDVIEISVSDTILRTDWEARAIRRYLLEQQVGPALRQAGRADIALPFGVVLTTADTITAIDSTLTDTWISKRIIESMKQIRPYLLGQTEHLSIVISLEDRVVPIASALADIADRKFGRRYEDLRPCESRAERRQTFKLEAFPTCRPESVSYQSFKDTLDLDVQARLIPEIARRLPRSITISREQSIGSLDERSMALIDSVRDTLTDGLTFTEKDLEALVRSNNDDQGAGDRYMERLETFRSWTRDGIVIDTSGLQEAGLDPKDARVRGRAILAVNVIKDASFYIHLMPWIIVVIIGLLGGRRWGSRLAWAGSTVFIAGCMTAILFGPVASFGMGAIDEWIRELKIEGFFIDKLLEVRRSLASAFIDPLKMQGWLVAAVGAGMVGLGYLSRRLNWKRSESHLSQALW